MRSEAVSDEDSDVIEIEDDDSVDTIDVTEGQEPQLDDEDGCDNGEDDNGEANAEEDKGRGRRRNRRGRGGKAGNNGSSRPPRGKAKASDEARAKRMNIRRRYKIQDVIHRRQVLLVQVVKEERGNKGAALTTYLSLAGRYCVLMPNTSHGGGISRKISSASDRKRLKSIIADMTLPATMGCIIRTAGLARTKPEIKRDFDYLARLWDEIREKTLKASAPELIHSDSDLIKRAIRDIYNRDIGEVIVEGDDGYRAAKDFMKLLMPSHAKRVKQYVDAIPLFQRYGAEDQLNAMYHPIVQLKSGGYIVINPTEALVSIDINSGRSTKEHGIEQTALSTNLEAAREIARQLRLRDMAGLVVIDFIDMEHHSNNRKVERAMKEALKNDRARIQVGRISSFGLMEMSRQRLRTGVLEASTRECPHCEGTGLVRTESSSALSALRLIEDEAARGNGSQIQLQASQEATIYVLNNKRAELAEIELRYHVSISIIPNGEDEGAKMSVSCSGPKPERPNLPPPIIDLSDDDDSDDVDDADETSEAPEAMDEAGPVNGNKRKRRRGRRGGRSRDRKNRDDDNPPHENVEAAGEEQAADQSETGPVESEDGAGDKPKAKRPRRVRKPKSEAQPDQTAGQADAPSENEPAAEAKPKRRRTPAKTKAVAAKSADIAEADEALEEKPKTKRASRAKAKTGDKADAVAEVKPVEEKAVRARKPRKKPEAKDEAPASDDGETDEKPAPRKRASRAKKAAEPVPVETAPSADVGSSDDGDGEKKTARTGWWQRTFG
ncbi:MAG: Rne/Rng family ribonuclease [Sphingomonadales bacterium]|nr:Rne/Rng family ribonuclease [Sphingomonadales bacterium]